MRLIFTWPWNRRFNKLQVKSSNSYGSIDKRTGYIFFLSYYLVETDASHFTQTRKVKRTQNTSVIIFFLSYLAHICKRSLFLLVVFVHVMLNKRPRISYLASFLIIVSLGVINVITTITGMFQIRYCVQNGFI